MLSVNVGWEDECSGMEDGGVELENGVELGDGVELEDETDLDDGVELGVTGLHEDADVYEGLTEPGTVRLMVSFTDRGDDMLFPISFIISVLPGTHCNTPDSTL